MTFAKDTVNWLKSHDMFGHTVNFNFNKKGDTHNTAPGGFFSLIIKLAVAIYVFMKLKILILSEGDNNSSALFLVTTGDSEATHVEYTETQLISTAELCINLIKENKIEKKCVGHNTQIEGIEKFGGIVSHSNFNKNFTDVSPAFNFEKFVKYIKDEQFV